MTVVLDHRRPLTLDDVMRVARREASATLAPETATLLAERRRQVVDSVGSRDAWAYGFNTGFGHNVKLHVDNDAELLDRLQLNLIRSHAMGLGEPVPPEVTRATMLLRAGSLARGHSGVRPEIVQGLLAMLEADVLPVVPRHGSVSASGDLCPLSHIALGLIGEGELLVDGERRPAADALARAGIAPLALQMKEGLALNNGCQFTTALGIVAADQLFELLRTASIATALANQVMLGSAEPYREDLHALRPHPGARAVAGWLRDLLDGSPIQRVHRDMRVDGEVQDPYNLRCAAQILGTCHELITDAQATFAIETNSVTDNPLILERDGAFTDIVSGGHFHGMPVAVKVYNLVQAAAIMARLSNMRCVRYVDEARNKGLGSDLMWPELDASQRATSSAMMAAEYTSASLTNWIWGQSMPSHLMSISTDAGQEDHVSMGAPLAVRLLEMLPRLAEVLAVELAFATQAAAIRKATPNFPSRAALPPEGERLRAQVTDRIAGVVGAEEGRHVEVRVDVTKGYPWSPAERQLSPACEAVLELLTAAFPAVTEDRYMAPQVAAIAELVSTRRICAAARQHASLG